jgi:hypothetical protein
MSSESEKKTIDGLTVFEIEQLERKKAFDALDKSQRDAVLLFLRSFVPVRNSVEMLAPVDYESLCALDSAWWRMRRCFGLEETVNPNHNE